jgi:hypothetical protein
LSGTPQKRVHKRVPISFLKERPQSPHPQGAQQCANRHCWRSISSSGGERIRCQSRDRQMITFWMMTNFAKSL